MQNPQKFQKWNKKLCQHQTEFTCNSGNCVSLGSRCDLHLDCEDATDELDCGILDK